MPMLLKPITRMNAAELASIPNAWEDGPPTEVFSYVCSICGEETGEAKVCGLDAVCPDCWEKYRGAHQQDYYAAYIAKHKEQFLLDWWLEKMKAEQKERLLAFLAEEYRLQKEADKLIGRRITEQEEADFCTCCLGFYEYVEEQLSR